MRLSVLCFAVTICSVETPLSTERTGMLVQVLQDAVNWHRLWYENPSDVLFLRTSSSTWGTIVDKRGYVALPDVGLAVELDVESLSMSPRNVEELPRHMDGRAAVDAYVRRRRLEAAHIASGKADRFKLPRHQSEPFQVRDGQTFTLGTIALPKKDPISVSQQELLRFAAFVRSTLQNDRGRAVCESKRAIIPTYGPRDPVVFVLVENGSQECSDFVVAFRRNGSEWTYDMLLNRFGDLDEIIRRIRARSKTDLAF